MGTQPKKTRKKMTPEEKAELAEKKRLFWLELFGNPDEEEKKDK